MLAETFVYLLKHPNLIFFEEETLSVTFSLSTRILKYITVPVALYPFSNDGSALKQHKNGQKSDCLIIKDEGKSVTRGEHAR